MKTVNFANRARFSVGVASAVLGVAMLSAPVQAQDAEDGATEEKEYVVTGSRIARPNDTSASPITSVSSEEIKQSGATNIEDLTNQLPQVFAGQSSGVSNGADGTATVNLRGLGSSRTLVLVDGRRLMPGGIGGGSAADLNFIPASLISGIDIMTGGASAAYGADAVAGVVNFKMNRKFQGIRLDAQYGLYQHNNNNDIATVVNNRFTSPTGSLATGGGFDVSLAIGTGVNDGAGNIVAYAGYRQDTAITQDTYDYSTCTLNPSGLNTGGIVDFACGGSGTPARSRIGGISAANAALAGLPTSAAGYTLTDAGTLIPYSGLRDAYNFAPLNYYRRPSNRFIAGAFAEYEVSSALKPYMDIMFMDYSTKAQIAPSGAFYGVRNVNCDNPFLTSGNPTAGRAICGANLGTATQATFLLGKRNVEGGPRFNDIGYNQFRIVTGAKGDISSAWNYDVSAQIGQIKNASTYRNDVSTTRINDALQVGGTLANPVCLSGNANCAPYNVFSPNSVSQAAANYIGIPLIIQGTVKEVIVGGVVTGDLGASGLKSPFAEEGIKVAFGAEYRKEQLETQPDLAYQNGEGSGQGGPTLPIKGSYSVRDIYNETVIPLVTDKTFFQDLSLELGYRKSSYSVPGGTDRSASTWKVQGSWAPVEDIRFRVSRNRAVRSPNIGELFSNQSVGLFAGTDPCAGTAVGGLVNGYTAAQCARTGVTAAQFGNLSPNSAQQYNGRFGGNLNLRPEKADTWTAGVVFKPESFLNGLVLSADYFNVKVKDAVGTIGAQVTLNQCVQTGAANFCSLINRAPASAGPAAGSLWLNESGFVDDRTTNTGAFKTSGVDFSGFYKTNIGENKISWKLDGTWLDKLISQPFTGGFDYDCTGFYGLTCGNSNPKWRFNTNVKLETANGFAVTTRFRFISAVKVDGVSPDADLASPGAAPKVDEKIPSFTYFDLLFAAPIKDTMTFRIGVNNVFDRDPPLISQASLPGTVGNGNVLVGTYDYLGRKVFVSLTADF